METVARVAADLWCCQGLPPAWHSCHTDKRIDACSRPLCYKLKFLAYKKRQKHEKKNYLFFYATYQCGRYNVFKFYFFPTKSLKNRPQKLLIISPNLLFHSPAHSPELIFHIIKCREQAFVLIVVVVVISCFNGRV